jgi:hypothetical protein
MKKLSALSLFAGVASIWLCSCVFAGPSVWGSGTAAKETRNAGGATKVALEGSGELIVTQGSANALTVECDDNIMQYVETSVSGDTLTLGIRDGYSIREITPLRFRLTLANPRRITVSGSGNATASALNSDSLDFAVSGSGDIKAGPCSAPRMTVSVSGSGNIDLSGCEADRFVATVTGSGGVSCEGSAKDATVTLSGSGEFRGSGFSSSGANVKTTGSGTIRIGETKKLSATLSGSGNVYYGGNPEIDVSITGSGNLRRN